MKKERYIDLVEKFIDFEIDNNLFDISVNGIKYWHLIRLSVFKNISQKKYNFVFSSHSPKLTILRLFKLFVGIFRNRSLIKRNPLLFNRNRDLLIFNHPRRVFYDGFFEELYTEPITLKTKLTHITIENPYQSSAHFRPIKTDSILYLDILKVLINLKIKLLSFFKILIKDDSIFTIQQLIEYKFDVKFENKAFYSLINRNIIEFKQYKRIYSKILDKIKPKVILQVVSYSTHLMALNVAAKKRGIPVIEMQHGTMGKYHIAYNFKVKYLDTFPDYVFVFGEYWKKTTRLPINADHVMVTGWPFFEENQNRYENHASYNDIETILFISQRSIGFDLSKIAVELQPKLNPKKYKIIYKLHPREYNNWKADYPWLLNTSIEVVENNNNNIHYFLARANYQIGVSSTALYEGFGYNLKTIIVDLNGSEYMEDVINMKLALLVNNSDEILDHLVSSSKLNNIDSDSFFLSDSLKRNLKVINELIELSNN